MTVPAYTTRAPRRAHGRERRHSAGYVGGDESRHLLGTVMQFASELMITAGLLLALLVVWELFWTDIGANREQEQIVAELDWDAMVLPIPADTTAPGASPEATGPVYPVLPASDIHVGETPPVAAAPAYAQTFATMYVPRWGLDYVKPISEGVSRSDVLDSKGIGHYPQTAILGEPGNFAVAAHRTTYARPFWDVDKLQIGDRIVIRTEDTWYVYSVTEFYIEQPSYVPAIAPVPGQPGAAADGHYLTLTTCHPKYSASERYIVHAELVYWAPASSGGFPTDLIPEGAQVEVAA